MKLKAYIGEKVIDMGKKRKIKSGKEKKVIQGKIKTVNIIIQECNYYLDGLITEDELKRKVDMLIGKI
jgi:hypothetical protein